MLDWILSPPFWVPALLILGGLLAAFFLRSGRKGFSIALAVVLFGVLWYGLDFVTETAKEEALRRTSTIIRATADGDWTAFSDAMDPNTGLPGRFDNRKEFVTGAKATVEGIGLDDVTIVSRQISEQAGAIDVDATVWSTQTASQGRMEKTVWRFRYVETRDGLVLKLIEPLEFGGQDVSTVMGFIRDGS